MSNQSRIVDLKSLTEFIAGREVIAKISYALARGGNVELHVMAGGAIAAKVRDAAKLDKRTAAEIGRIISIESVKHGGRVTLDAVEEPAE
jgi:hypothetical protein